MAILTKIQKEKLNKEILKFQNLPRRERNIKQRELRKKYGDNTIKIKSGKTFTKSESLNREQRRALLKDKNLLEEVMKIINKYFPDLMSLFSNLTDNRNKSYITYNIRTIIMTRLMALICGITTMNKISSKFNTKSAIENLSLICKEHLKEIPNWQTIQDVIEEIKIDEIEDIRKSMVQTLIRSKMFDKYRYEKGLQLVVDATGISSHDYNLNGTCITKKSKDGKVKYYKYVLEAKIRVGSLVISLDTEWIENNSLNNEKEKQDCEVNAFKRMAPRIKKNYPKLKFIITGDALYATTPMIEICKEYNWDYIFNLKKERLKNVWQNFEDNLNYENEVNKENYYLSSNIEFKNNCFSALRYVDKENNKTFNYITNLKVDNYNIEEVVSLGRARWKIENCGFYVQKHNTFCISHLCSKNENGLKVHYLLIQIAHIIRQLLEFGSIFLRSLKFSTKKEISESITQSLTSSTNQNLNNLEINFQLRFDT